MRQDDDTFKWSLPCPKCGHKAIRWLDCYAAERLTIKALGVRIECDKCKHQGPIARDKTAAIKGWIDDRDT